MFVLSCPTAHASSGKIALTFDDLPALTVLRDQSYVDQLNRKLIRGLKRHHLPTTGFVNEGKLGELDRQRQSAVLEEWLDNGFDLGNHTYSHESPNILGAKAYIEDIIRGEPVLRALLEKQHKTLRWFRHPYLETGSPEEVKAQIDTWLAQHGYRVAPVTIDASDWEFAEPYDAAVARRDGGERRRIRQEYLDYTARMIAWYRKSARALFGRDISYVLLLHATRLNADSIAAIAAILRHANLRAVSLDEALEDPAYRTIDPYSGRDGIEWLERWSLTLHKDLPWDDFIDPPADIKMAYDRIDNDQPANMAHAPHGR
ncbi:polysaccharide deacetylase family protein [Sphingobium sp. EM0848]|uniref:polysaccharide deacetylase family protein n=1 Tax=Sphingobium sp. EM0848 TaxID=2743473 RepID=UPI002101B98B|nr:polysaccharide deacetylase family protein [Sphingobium sp. EM0848]